MKRFLFTTAIFLLVNISYGQAFKEGNVVGVHVITIELKPGVCMADFQRFHTNTLIPAYKKNYPGWQLFLVKGLRGKNQNKFGWIIVVESEEVRDKYYNDDGSVTEFGMEAALKMKPILEEAEKFGKLQRTYTDWIIL